MLPTVAWQRAAAQQPAQRSDENAERKWRPLLLPLAIVLYGLMYILLLVGGVVFLFFPKTTRRVIE